MEMLMRQVAVHQLRGKVYNQVTHKPGTENSVFLIPKNNNQMWDSTKQSEVKKADGSFVINEVVPGAYVLLTTWFDEGKQYMTRQVLEVGNTDIEGIALSIVPGTTINGHIVWDGRARLEADELRVGAVPTDIPFDPGSDSRVTHDYGFALKDIGAGRYRAFVNGQSKDCFIKDVRYGETSGLKDGFNVLQGEPNNLEITISSHGARVRGTVTDGDGLPQAGVTVALVPEKSRREEFDLYKAQNTDQYGHFELRGIAPGEYKVFSWEEVEQGAWEDGEFLKEYEDKGERVVVADDDNKELKITVIGVKSADAGKP
jgi:hypothetical protein